MNCKVLAALGLSALLAAPALAGLNPASPGLPNVTDAAFAAAVPNNQASAMCVDCHTVAPVSAGGSHYVNTAIDGTTWSGGTGINAAGTIAGRDAGQYFKAGLWNANSATGTSWPSKYGYTITGNVTSVVNQYPTGVTSMNATIRALTGAEDMICESCHNIVGNEDGGNNLLAVQPGNDFVNGPTSELCVVCHGFMYSSAGAVVTASANDNNINDARNNLDIGTGRRGNNEYHWVRGTAYPQNHHVMTGDEVDAAKALAGALWTDNLIIAYADHTMANNYAGGTLPQRATWSGITRPSATTDLSCTSCHTPAHGPTGSGAASILRNATYTGTAPVTRIDRIITRGGWKKINDLAFCSQCHIN